MIAIGHQHRGNQVCFRCGCGSPIDSYSPHGFEPLVETVAPRIVLGVKGRETEEEVGVVRVC